MKAIEAVFSHTASSASNLALLLGGVEVSPGLIIIGTCPGHDTVVIGEQPGGLVLLSVSR
jgi:hypothetical protein